MEKIKRPKKVQKAEKNYLTNEKYQEYSESQFINIYDYLDKIIEEKLDGTVLYENSVGVSTDFELDIDSTGFKTADVYIKKANYLAGGTIFKVDLQRMANERQLFCSYWFC